MRLRYAVEVERIYGSMEYRRDSQVWSAVRALQGHNWLLAQAQGVTP
jgi:hypothetical protein